MRYSVKDTAKEILAFGTVTNVIGWILMIVADFALEIAFGEEAMLVVGFGWPIVVAVAYIVFDLKQGLDGTAEPSERFVECFVRGFVWSMVTGILLLLAVSLVGHGPWLSPEVAEVWFESDVIMYAVFGGIMIIGVVFVMVAWFMAREIYYLFKKKA